MVALTFAVRYPEKVDRLILFGGTAPAGLAPPPDRAQAPQFGAWMQLGKTCGLDSLRAAIGRWAGANFGAVTPEMSARAMRLLATYDGEDLLDPAPPSNLAPPAEAGDVGRVAAPTLVLVGELDMRFIRLSADALAGALPDARKVVIPGSGHVANWSQPERFAAEVLGFLR